MTAQRSPTSAAFTSMAGHPQVRLTGWNDPATIPGFSPAAAGSFLSCGYAGKIGSRESSSWPSWPGVWRLSCPSNKRLSFGLDLQGGVRVLLQLNTSPEVPTITAQVQSQVQQVIQNRINGLGVSEPVLTPVGADRLLVELPNVKNPDEAVKTLKDVATLDFKIMPPAVLQRAMADQKYADDPNGGVQGQRSDRLLGRRPQGSAGSLRADERAADPLPDEEPSEVRQAHAGQYGQAARHLPR